MNYALDDAVARMAEAADRERVAAARRVLIVGEMNPYGAEPDYALYPQPPGCAGDRLRRLVLDLPTWVYMETKRVNLCTDKWSMPAARERAAELYREHVDTADRRSPLSMGVDVVVLLGRKVTEAFSRVDVTVAFAAPFSARTTDHGGEAEGCTTTWRVRWVSLPHPSGLSRLWNEPKAFERARRLVIDASPRMWAESYERGIGTLP